MKVGPDFGIIPDSKETIFNQLLLEYQQIFSDATDAGSPAYVLATIDANQLSILQDALCVLANAKNAYTSQGLGLDQLAGTVVNLTRRDQTLSYAIVTFTATLSSGAITIPAGWNVSDLDGVTYSLLSDFSVPTNGNYSVILYSEDIDNAVAANQLVAASSDFSGQITAVTNPSAAILGLPEETDAEFQRRRAYYLNIEGQSYYGMEIAILNLQIPALTSIFVEEVIDSPTVGQRGYRIFLLYPTLSSGFFDTTDPFLQNIAQTAFNYHTFGTQLYGDEAFSTQFIVKTPYSGYEETVYLTPITLDPVKVNMTFIYNTDEQDAGLSGGIFPVQELATLKENLIVIINRYFQSKTLPTDMVFYITELSNIIEQNFSGIYDLKDFSFEFIPTTGEKSFIRKQVGHVFNLVDTDFNFTAVNKDSL